LVAGLAFLVVVMVAGALATTPWAVPDAIAAVLGFGTNGYRFQAVPVLVGIAGHLTVSVILGVGYLAAARRLRLRRGLLVVGAWLFSGVETPVSLWGVLHTVLTHQTFDYYLRAIPFWASFLGHTTYGIVLGLMAAWLGPVGRHFRRSSTGG
jgi:RsiW-degrading membrane proteinase PrsW (M82 family)